MGKEAKWGEIGKISASEKEPRGGRFLSPFSPNAEACPRLTSLLFKYEPFVVFGFDNLRNPEQRKLKFFCTALVLNLCKFPKFICLTDIEFGVI